MIKDDTESILRNPDISKIYISYLDKGKRVKYEVAVRFADSKEIYVAMPSMMNFEKPQKRIPIEIVTYTPEGVHKGNAVLSDVEVTIAETMFILNAPQAWKYTQMRLNTRKLANIKITLSFNDGFKIEAPSYNISLGGISFFSKEKLSSIYTKLPCQLTLDIPILDLDLFPDGTYTVTGRFVREKEKPDEFHQFEILYVFKFVGLTFEQEEILDDCLRQ